MPRNRSASGSCQALQEPIRQITENVGVDKAVAVSEVGKGLDAGKENYGFNARTGQYEEDMMKAGIVNPTKVVRSSLQNAASIASLLLTTECVITDIPEEKDDKHAGHGGMGGGMGMGGMY